MVVPVVVRLVQLRRWFYVVPKIGGSHRIASVGSEIRGRRPEVRGRRRRRRRVLVVEGRVRSAFACSLVAHAAAVGPQHGAFGFLDGRGRTDARSGGGRSFRMRRGCRGFVVQVGGL
jgi:hypothetical protein